MQYIRFVLTLLIILVSSITYAQEEASADESLNTGGFNVLAGVRQLEDQANTYGIVIPPGYLDGPGKDDIGYKALTYILGKPVADATTYLNNNLTNDGGGLGEFTTPLTQMLGLVSGIALVVGAILMAFILWAGLTKTSVEGDFLGKKWDSYWLPIRITGSLSSLAPFPGFGGLSLVQVAVLVLVLLAIGMGSTLWSWFLGSSTSQPIVPTPSFASTQFFNNILSANACARYLHWYDEETYSQISMRTESIDSEKDGIRGQKFIISAAYDKRACGEFKLSYNVGHAAVELNNNQMDVSSDKLQDFVKAHFIKVFLFGASGGASNPSHGGGNASNLLKVWNTATLINEHILSNALLGPSSADYDIATPIQLYNNEVARLQKLFWDEMTNPAFKVKIAMINEATVEKGRNGGFFMAGPYYTVIRNIQNNFNNGLTALFNEINGSFELSDNNIGNTSHKSSADYRNFMNEYQKTIITAANNSTTFSNSFELTAEDIIRTEGNISGIMSLIGQGIFKMLRGDRLNDGDDDAETVMHDPMMEFQSIGQTIGYINFIVSSGISAARIGASSIEAGSNHWAAQIATLGTGKIFGSLLVKSIEVLWEMWSKVMTIMFGIELLYTVVLPTMPLVMWIVGCLGYLIYVVEALVASPFWMVMHSHPDGDEVFGKGASGYPIVMTIVLYPSLMVFGLAAGMQIVHAMGWVTWTLALPAITATLGESSLLLTSLLGVLLIYGMLVLALIYKSFSLVHELPNSILQWMGVGSHFADLGERDAMNSIGAMKSEGVGVLAAMAANQQLQNDLPHNKIDGPNNPPTDSFGGDPDDTKNDTSGDNIQNNSGRNKSDNDSIDAERNLGKKSLRSPNYVSSPRRVSTANNSLDDISTKKLQPNEPSHAPSKQYSFVEAPSVTDTPNENIEKPDSTKEATPPKTLSSSGTSSGVAATSAVSKTNSSNNPMNDVAKTDGSTPSSSAPSSSAASSSAASSSAPSSSAPSSSAANQSQPNNPMNDVVKLDDPMTSKFSASENDISFPVDNNSISNDSGPKIDPKEPSN